MVRLVVVVVVLVCLVFWFVWFVCATFLDVFLIHAFQAPSTGSTVDIVTANER